MKNDAVYYLYSPSLLINEKFTNPITSVKEKDSLKLFSTLIKNYIELIKTFEKEPIIYILFKNYTGFVLNELGSFKGINLNEEKIILSSVVKNSTGEIRDKHIIINTDSIGLTLEKLNSIKNLLNNEDNCLISGTTSDKRIILYAANKPELADYFIKYLSYLDVDDFLLNENDIKYLFFTFNNFYSINSDSDFKNLYKVLSLKENFNFCSQKIHEELTNIFIEYKELLK